MITANKMRQLMPQHKIDKKKIRNLINTIIKSARETAIQGGYAMALELDKEEISFGEIDYFCKKLRSLGFRAEVYLETDNRIKFDIGWSKE